MKNSLFFFIAISVTLTLTSCSEIPENNDAIIGIWSKTVISDTGNQLSKKEWTFNDAYLGRYHDYSYDNSVFLTDFSWTVENGVYTISYPGTDMPDEIVTLEPSAKNSSESSKSTNTLETDVLLNPNGATVAIRE